MTKTLALLLDSYRELNAKRLFWIVLLLSALVVLVFACIGLKGDTITFLWFSTPIRSEMLTYLEPARMYELMFTAFGVNYWLAWIATLLALVSTAGIFPDFMAGGSIDLYLSKPIARLRLFMTKYMGGMLFVTLQVAIFSICSFFVLGLRGHSWEPKIFLSIPLVVAVFSYLFSICVLLGVLTRSTVASILITVLIWFGLWGVQTAEPALLGFSIMQDARAISLDRQIKETQYDLDHYSTTRPVTTTGDGSPVTTMRGMVPFGLFGSDQHQELRDRLAHLQSEREQIGTGLKTSHRMVFYVYAVLPKTQATTDLLTRALIKDQSDTADDNTPEPNFPEDRGDRRERREMREYMAREIKKELDSRSASWILGTSFGFEAVIVTLAAWMFCRRDY